MHHSAPERFDSRTDIGPDHALPPRPQLLERLLDAKHEMRLALIAVAGLTIRGVLASIDRLLAECGTDKEARLAAPQYTVEIQVIAAR